MKKLIILGFGILLCLYACKTSKNNAFNYNSGFPSFSTEAHRGGRGLMPENTIIAMRNAIDIGVTTLEMDTHITKDGRVVVTHDDYLSQGFMLTPDGKDIPVGDSKRYAVYQMNYDLLKTFDLGSKIHAGFPDQKKVKSYIPLLADLIDSVQQYSKGKKQMFYNIETKCSVAGDNILNPEPEKFVELLMGVIESKGITPYVVIQSFDKRTLQILNKKYPKVKTSFLVDNEKDVEQNLTDLGFNPFIISPAFKMVDEAMVKKSHEKHIKVIPWTVNTRVDINRLKQMGVDGIISDYPNLFADFFPIKSSTGQSMAWDSTYRPAKYKELIEKFNADKKSEKDFVFLGNSITAGGNWAKLLDLPNAKNRGISGDITFGVLERLNEVISGKPAKVFILIGINDISRNIPDSIILRNYKTIISRIRKGSKRTRIYFYTLLPVNSEFNKFKNHYGKDKHILWLNEQIRNFKDKQLTIIELYPQFIDGANHLRADLTKDGLHLNDAGYKIWCDFLKNEGYVK